MRPTAWFTFLGILVLVLGLVGCGGVAPREQPAETAPAAAAPEVVQPKPPPPPPLAVLDQREKRRLTSELLRDVAEYYRLLQEKNVEQASAYVDLENRKDFQDDLWGFVARYKIESADVASYQLYPQLDLVMAKVKVVRTLFEKHSVKPERSEHWMTWEHRQHRWVLLPQRQK
jgi:hypothetical protein